MFCVFPSPEQTWNLTYPVQKHCSLLRPFGGFMHASVGEGNTDIYSVLLAFLWEYEVLGFRGLQDQPRGLGGEAKDFKV